MNEKKYMLAEEKKKKIEDKLSKELSRRKEIIFAYLHGSFLLHVPFGDIDIAVFLADAAVKSRHWEYEAELAAHLENRIRVPVDVLILNRVPVALRYHATCGKVLVSKNEFARFTFLEETWREYFDYRPYLKAYYNDLLN